MRWTPLIQGSIVEAFGLLLLVTGDLVWIEGFLVHVLGALLILAGVCLTASAWLRPREDADGR
ncbi:MAG: hypothetical protein ACYS99_09430 [Planctomycetota bacterium]|jgi:hypothetical protein